MIGASGKSRKLPPESHEAQALVVSWQAYITANFYVCTNKILAGLGQMYLGDVRFTENIDKNGSGTAVFMAQAIAIYCADGTTEQMRGYQLLKPLFL